MNQRTPASSEPEDWAPTIEVLILEAIRTAASWRYQLGWRGWVDVNVNSEDEPERTMTTHIPMDADEEWYLEFGSPGDRKWSNLPLRVLVVNRPDDESGTLLPG